MLKNFRTLFAVFALMLIGLASIGIVTATSVPSATPEQTVFRAETCAIQNNRIVKNIENLRAECARLESENARLNTATGDTREHRDFLYRTFESQNTPTVSRPSVPISNASALPDQSEDDELYFFDNLMLPLDKPEEYPLDRIIFTRTFSFFPKSRDRPYYI